MEALSIFVSFQSFSLPLFFSMILILLPSEVGVAEPSNLMPPRSACLLLDTKHSMEDTKSRGRVEHTPGENLKIHIFIIRITNERIKLTSFLTISYITFNTTSEYNNDCITAKCNHLFKVYEQFN